MAQLIFPNDEAHSKQLSKKVASGELKRIRQGIYTDAPYEKINELVNKQWYKIVDYLYPSAIASHSTAETLKPVNGLVYITANIQVRKKIKVADSLTIDVLPGNTKLLTEMFMPELSRTAPARHLMENLQISHRDVNAPKSLGKIWVEESLSKLLDRHGEKELNKIRDLALKNAEKLKLNKEAKMLDGLIGAILSTQPINNLDSPQAIALAKKEPYDPHRITLFTDFSDYLKRCEVDSAAYEYNTASWRHLSFYESYFSNYIEGTEFEIDEAEKIIFEKTNITNRKQDSHDVLAVYDLTSDYTEMATLPDNADELLNLLTERHAIIMKERPDKMPGILKSKANKAGDTLFVLPSHVEGTLSQAFSIYQSLPQGLHRAIFMQFLIAECHPFDDGNGRLARIMMNAELVATEQHKIIVPTVHRDSYLNGLRQATRSSKFRTLTKVFASLQAYSASINWQDYGEARTTLQEHMADKLPDQGVAIFNKQLAKFKLFLPAG